MSNFISNTFKRFQRVYWIVLSFELMERAAYYTMMPIIVVHAIWNVGMNPGLALILTAFMYPFQYGFPIFTSAYAEKFGYRKQMMLAFSILFAAYLSLSFAFNSLTMILSVMLLGFGIGLYKPLISSTIAKCTPQEDRNYAYSIYYWIVNLAAFVFPVIWVIIFTATAGREEGLYRMVFRIGSLFFLGNIFIAIFIFKEVPRSGNVKTLKDVTNNIKTAFVDKKFVVMMLLMAGFWSLYSATLGPLQTIAYGFRFLPDWFSIMLLGVFNPGTIILLGFPLAKLVEKVESIKALMGGVLIYLIGFSSLALLGFTLHWSFIIFSIMIYSIGEFMVAPGYLAFVSKLAPKEKVSAYIGCNFLASFAGIWGGTLLFGSLANLIAVKFERPYFFFGTVISLGLLILVGFLSYYKKWGQDIVQRTRIIESEEKGIPISELKSKISAKEPFLFRIFDKKGVSIVAIGLIPVVLISTFTLGSYTFYPPVEKEEEEWVFDPNDYNIIAGFSDEITGSLQDGGSDTPTISIQLEEGQYLQSITCKLTWRDETDPNALLENQPDEFSLSVSDESNEHSDSGQTANSHGSEGSITIGFDFEHHTEDSLNGTGDWEVEITLESCGDSEGRLAIWTQPDNSNSYTLEITTEVYDPIEEG